MRLVGSLRQFQRVTKPQCSALLNTMQPIRRWKSTSVTTTSSVVGLGFFHDKSAAIGGLMDQIGTKIEQRGIRKQVEELSKEVSKPSLWDNPEHAAKVSQLHGSLSNILQQFDSINSSTEETLELATLAFEEGAGENQQVIIECEKEIVQLERKAKRFHLEMLLDGPADQHGCFIEVIAGAGGHEACDFAEMLLNMYARWAQASGYRATMTDSTPGGEGGLKSGILQIDGVNAYGWTKSESGVHRMVRISEYDTQKRRHTCFCRVAVLPVQDSEDDKKFDIPEDELRIETYRSSGSGGQHANTTDSAVRITHIPTGISASSQKERSQHLNKRYAMSVLKSRVLQSRLDKESQARNEFTASLGENTWGNQIRSYVLHPYKLIKDHRTQHETSNAQAVLDGDPVFLNPFMEAALYNQ